MTAQLRSLWVVFMGVHEVGVRGRRRCERAATHGDACDEQLRESKRP